MDRSPLLFLLKRLNYYIFQIIGHAPLIWEENGSASYSPNVAHLAPGVSGGRGGAGFFPYFPPLKPRCVLWSGASYSLKNTVYTKMLSITNPQGNGNQKHNKILLHTC